MYLIITDIFYVNIFPLKFVNYFLNAQMLERRLLTKMLLTSAKDNQIKIFS
jgi:hypothetical protein